MNKKILIVALFVILTSHSVLAVNLDFTITPSKKLYYPNETIPINISVMNRDVSWAAKNITLTILIGQRTYNYGIGNLSPSQSYNELITLPEQPSGTYTIRGILNYTWLFDEIFTTENYNSFEVRFPEIQRLPRDVYVQSFDLPENITSGKTYSVSVNVINNGTIGGNISVELSSLNASASNQIYLGAGQSTTVPISITFYNPGISIVEAKVYGVVDNIKYLLNYVSKNVYVTEEKIAKIGLDKVEIVDRDNFVYQTDDVKIRVYLKNSGNSAAASIKGILSSNENTIKVTKNLVDYILIAPNESIYSDEFEISTISTPVGSYNLNLDVNFTDFAGSHLVSFIVPVAVKENVIPPCSKDADCKTDEVCQNTKCTKLSCECGSAIDHSCIKYGCCSDYDCEEGYTCSSQNHVCEPSKEIKTDVLIVTSSKLKTDNAYADALKKYRKAILNEGLTSFYILVDSPKVQEIFNIQPASATDWVSVKNVLDKIIYKVNPKYLLILGGVDTIPQPPAKTDAEIPTVPPSDDIYSDSSLDGIPDVAYGRIPIDDVNVITSYLNMLTEIHKKAITINNKIIIGDACGGSDCFLYKDVDYASEFIFGMSCEQNSNCFKSPPYCSGRGSPPIFPVPCEKKDEMTSDVKKSDFIFFGAHGDGTGFYSVEKAGGGIIGDVILSGNQIFGMNFSKKIIMSFACFGGSIDVSAICLSEGVCAYPKLKASESTALASIYKNVLIYVGNTRFGYGGTASAQLYKEIYDGIKSGETIGDAILKMKRDRLSSAYSEWGKAIIYEIQLYGDPTIKLTGV